MTNPELLQKLIKEVNRTIGIYQDISGEIASRTRKMIEERGVEKALPDLVTSAELQPGFKTLRDAGRLDDTFEAIIVKFPKLFPAQVVEAAQWRLDNSENLG